MGFNEYNFLCHHGILGMKWGVRRYQNADGTLTAAGERRLARARYKEYRADKKVMRSSKKEAKEAYRQAKNLNRQLKDVEKTTVKLADKRAFTKKEKVRRAERIEQTSDYRSVLKMDLKRAFNTYSSATKAYENAAKHIVENGYVSIKNLDKTTMYYGQNRMKRLMVQRGYV